MICKASGIISLALNIKIKDNNYEKFSNIRNYEFNVRDFKQ